MQFFTCSFDKIVIRYYLMMACVITGVFLGQPLLALLALPLFLSAILGVTFTPERKTEARRILLKTEPQNTNKAA